MNRKFLEGFGLTKEQINRVLDENSADIGKLKSEISEKQKKIEALSALHEAEKQSMAELRQKILYERRRNLFFFKVEFVSEYAKRGVFDEFDKKNFTYIESQGKFAGAEEWLKKLMRESPATFKDLCENSKCAKCTLPKLVVSGHGYIYRKCAIRKSSAQRRSIESECRS